VNDPTVFRRDCLKPNCATTLFNQHDSALTMHSNPRMTDGEAYVCQGGMVGAVGFEFGLTAESWLDQAIRSWRVQSFVVPAMAVDHPHSIKKLTALASS
jgi:hypothetical protein